MTSEERHELRYQRRKAKREEKKKQLYPNADNYKEVFSYANLYKAYKKCRRGVIWKASVQRYAAIAPLNVYKTYEQLTTKKYRSPGFYAFDICERGKLRHIQSTVIGERVVQRCLCDNALVPMLCRSFVYDNGASMKDKGYSFAINRITAHLQKHYRQYGNNGYVLLFDFTKFFKRVSHEIIKRKVDKNFTDERLLDLMHHFIDVFGDVGLGLGSQISQVLALASADRLDHFIKEELRAKYYARYMDDGYIIDISKERLQECRDKIKAICEELNITINESKTQIVKLSHGFTWLKVRFYLTDSGKIVKKIYKRSITKERQRLKKLAQRWRDGKIPLETVNASFQSWKSYAANFDAYFTTQNMTELYNNLVSEK